MPIGPPSTGMAKTLSPWVTSFQAPSLKLPFTSSAPYGARSTSAFWMEKLLNRSASSMTTSARPFPAEIAVCTLVYSSPPSPTLFQQICTSVWFSLKLSTTFGMFGYQAHTETCGASFFILFVQLVSFGGVFSSSVGAPLAPPPLLLALVAQADSRRPVAKAMTPAKRFLLFIFDPFVLRGRRCSKSDVRERAPSLRKKPRNGVGVGRVDTPHAGIDADRHRSPRPVT